MANKRQISPDLLVNRRGGRDKRLIVSDDGQRVVPDPPDGLSDYAALVWRQFFGDWVSKAVIMSADGERLRWWIQSVDLREQLRQQVARVPAFKGKSGQIIVNPLWRVIDRLTRDIERTEEAFGMTAISRFRLQLTATEAKRSANDLRRELMLPEVPRGDDGIIDGDSL